MDPTVPTTRLRTMRQRVVNTLVYEAGAILLVGPIIMLTTNHTVADGMGFLVVVSLVFVCWALLHNLLFDLVERALGGGPASARGHRLRLCHAICLEVSSVFVTLPVIMYLSGLPFWEAMAVDIGLSLIYAAYAYVFHLCYDRFYPVPVAGNCVASKAAI